MALEQLRLAPNPVDAVTNGVDTRLTVTDGGEDSNRTPRLPRWTRQEILVLIQGKRVAESRVRRGRTAGMAFGSGQIEPKWASVSSYCKRHGVNRGPVQCRKRWSNLAGDFKKIKEWESRIKEESESFWVMRNDLRRERKLPGFFDKEVYDILDGGVSVIDSPGLAPPGLILALGPASVPTDPIDPPEEKGAVFDSGRSAATEDGLFSDFEHEEAACTPDKEATKPVPAPVPISVSGREKQGAEIGSTSQDQRKRKRSATDGEEGMSNLQDQFMDILERNGKMLNAQLEAQNINFELDREQRKEHANSLVSVLNKLADALGKIADKL